MARKIPPRDDRQKILDAEIVQNGKELRKVLLKSKARIELRIVNATKKGNIASAARLRDTLYKDLRKEYVALQGNLDVWTASSVESVAKDWSRLAVNDLPNVDFKDAWAVYSKKYLQTAIEQFSPATIAGRVATTAGQLSPQLGGMLKQDIDVLRKVVIDTTRLQASEGLTAQEWRREVQARVMEERGGAWQFIDKSGKKWTANNYFNMLNRTLAGDTARETYATQMAEAGHDLATIEGGIPPNCCPFCLKWTGKIVSISGSSEKYRSVEDAKKDGAFHPRCRHYLAVMFPGEEEEVAEQEAEMREDAAEKGYPVTEKKVAPGDVPTKDKEAAEELKGLTAPPEPPKPVASKVVPPKPQEPAKKKQITLEPDEAVLTDTTLNQLTDPLRKKAKFGDEVVFIQDGKFFSGTISGPDEGEGIVVTAMNGKKYFQSRDSLRMPKGGFRTRGE